MEKRKLKWLTWGIVAFMVLAVGLILSGTLRRTSHITLPEAESATGQDSESPSSVSDALTVIEITPSTVQAAIETLARPESYRRTVTIEQHWDGGSGSYEVTVTVNGPWTRTDRTMPDGRARHTITGPETVYIWYNNEENVYSAPVGAVSADVEQSIPTYEDILELPLERIAAADYRMVADVYCIYVETAEDAAGYVLRYWVSVDTGLLVVAEKLENGSTVYRMAALTADQTSATEGSFCLPDGSSVLE